MAQQNGSVVLAHVVEIQNYDTGSRFEAFVDAHSGEVVHLTNFVASASVRGLELFVKGPGLTERLISIGPSRLFINLRWTGS